MLTISEIYTSIQGESTHVGRPCVFVRLAACDLRCHWCDTPYAFTGGRSMTVDDVVDAVRQSGARLVEVTGGEPLLQADVIPLLAALAAGGFEVLLETGGHLPIDHVPDPVRVVLDVKCPSSGEADAMHWPNLDRIDADDEIKFVIADRTDFDYACQVVRRHDLGARARAVLFSPVFGTMPPDTLARWILDAGLPVRLQLQAHKYVWAPETRGV